MDNQKKFLTTKQIESFVLENKYEFDQDLWYLSRCIDGRYSTIENLEPLAKPGADLGDLMMLLSTNNQYALNLKPEIMLSTLINTIGGVENMRIHTDSHNCHHADKNDQCLGCGHFKQASLDPAAYGLEKDDINFIFEALQQLKTDGVKNDILDGDHMEKAVIIVKSHNYSVAPMMKKNGNVDACFIYHKTLDDRRRRLLAQNLLTNLDAKKEITEEYLYEILTTVSDQQLFETVARLAPEYPIYNVSIDQEGEVIIEE